MFFLFTIITALLTLFFITNISFYNILFIWNPWLNFWSENYILQLLLLFLVYYIFTNSNPYFILLYLFLQIVTIGLFLSYYQIELFTAFLWVIEFTVVLVCLILLFYFNISGFLKSSASHMLHLYFIVYFVFFIFISLFVPLSKNNELFFSYFNYFFFIWENYYESLNFSGVNDVTILSISYYTLNSLELLILGFILLIGSVVCIILNKYQRLTRNVKISNTLNIINVYNFLINSFFLRKQNMTNQNNLKASLNVFKKLKKKKVIKTTQE